MTFDPSQLRQWLEERRDKAAEKMRSLPAERHDVIVVARSAKASAEYFMALDVLDKVRELESK